MEALGHDGDEAERHGDERAEHQPEVVGANRRAISSLNRNTELLN
nr:hypothetical protein [uncultured Roseateles sp.]